MASGPTQPIPETTQVHVDRLVGSKLGDLEVGSRVSEGRFGTLYRARQRTTGAEVTLEVLRTGQVGDDGEVRATNAIKCAGIAEVTGFGEVPDGRRYRVMEALDGESLEQVLQRRGRLPAKEAVVLLGRVAEVLAQAHAWALAHGNLGPSSIFVVGDAVKVIDFGLAKEPATVDGDLQQLGSLGYWLLTGRDLEGLTPPPGSGIPAPLDQVLRDLIDVRLKDATAAQRELKLVEAELGAPPRATVKAAAPAPRRSRVVPLVVLAAVVAGVGGGAGVFVWSRGAHTSPVAPAETGDRLVAEDDGPVAGDEGVEVGDAPGRKRPERVRTGPRRPGTSSVRRAAPVPTAAALLEETVRLEARLRKVGSPDDVDQAMYVLSKQRLRLSGSPTERDRREVAQQLAGWRRSYLRR